jgi:hypothetical protein
MRVSLVGQATSVGSNLNNVIHVASVLKYCAFLGMSVAMDVLGDPIAESWIVPSGVPLIEGPGDVDVAEVVLRAFRFPGDFPVRPVDPFVVDMVFEHDDRSGVADHTLAFYDLTPSTVPDPITETVNVVAPLPREMVNLLRTIVPGRAVVFLGQDPGNRGPGIVASIIGTRPPRVVGKSRSGEAIDANITAHTIALPEGVQAGELLLAFASFSANPTVTWPAGWTQFFGANNGSSVRLEAAWRTATGSENGDIVMVTTSAGCRSAHVAYRVSGWLGAPIAAAAATGGSTTPNSPNLAPGPAADRLWIAAEAHDCSGAYGSPLTAFPVNYVNGVSALASSCGVAVAGRGLTAAAEDPGAFAKLTTTGWVATTIAIGAAPSPFSAVQARIPDSVDFWNELRTADVLLASAGIPHLSGVVLGVPTLLATNNAAEEARISGIVPLNERGWEHVGTLPALTDLQVADAVRALLSTDAANRAKRLAMSAQGYLRSQSQGVRWIAEWIYRQHVGTIARVNPLVSSPQWPNVSAAPQTGIGQ